MFPPHISTRTLNLERERRGLRPSASSPNGVKDMVDLVTVTQGIRGRMPSRCLWYACQAFAIGIILFSVGTVMSYLGFEADGVFTNNGTAAGDRAYFYEDARGANVKFSKLSYAGPIVMGVGGFIILSACVITFEARDSAAKVGPAAYVASEEVSMPYPVITRPRTARVRSEVRTTGTQTNENSSSDTLHNLHIFDKKNLLETFRKFSRTVRQSSSKEEDIHRCPSAPNLFDEEDVSKTSVPPAAIAARRSSCLPKFRNRVPPVLLRQAVSIDCSSSSPFLPIIPGSSNMSQTLFAMSSGGHHPPGGSCGQIKSRNRIHRTSTNTSAASDRASGSGDLLYPNSQSTSRAVSNLSMDNTNSYGSGVTVRQAPSESSGGTVDLHLPNGMVTLNVIHSTDGSMLGGSSTCLHTHTLSPHPNYHSQSDDSSFDMGSVKSDNVLLPKSPMKPFKSYRSESFGRPSSDHKWPLVRQSKVDQAEIIYIPDSDEEQQQPIPEAEHESDTD